MDKSVADKINRDALEVFERFDDPEFRRVLFLLRLSGIMKAHGHEFAPVFNLVRPDPPICGEMEDGA
jgi:hypothetical protein